MLRRERRRKQYGIMAREFSSLVSCSHFMECCCTVPWRCISTGEEQISRIKIFEKFPRSQKIKNWRRSMARACHHKNIFIHKKNKFSESCRMHLPSGPTPEIKYSR